VVNHTQHLGPEPQLDPELYGVYQDRSGIRAKCDPTLLQNAWRGGSEVNFLRHSPKGGRPALRGRTLTGRRGPDSLVVQSLNMRAFTIALAILTTSMLADAASAVHTFRVWGTESATQKSTYGEKLSMYIGWSNGYFSGHVTY